MSKLVIVLNEDGTLDAVFADSEVDVSVLQRGKEDEEIAATEIVMEEVVI